MEENLELMYVDAMNNFLELVDLYHDPVEFEKKRQACRTKVNAIVRYKTASNKLQSLVLTKDQNLIDKYCDEIRKLFYDGNVQDFKKKYRGSFDGSTTKKVKMLTCPKCFSIKIGVDPNQPAFAKCFSCDLEFRINN